MDLYVAMFQSYSFPPHLNRPRIGKPGLLLFARDSQEARQLAQDWLRANGRPPNEPVEVEEFRNLMMSDGEFFSKDEVGKSAEAAQKQKILETAFKKNQGPTL
jgi:hypothetical protein